MCTGQRDGMRRLMRSWVGEGDRQRAVERALKLVRGRTRVNDRRIAKRKKLLKEIRQARKASAAVLIKHMGDQALEALRLALKYGSIFIAVEFTVI